MAEQLSVRIDDGDHECLQAMALLTGKSMAVLVVDAIRTEIGRADIDSLVQQRVTEVQRAGEYVRRFNLIQAQSSDSS